MLFSLKGKCALVTGSTGGIGKAIVQVLHSQGAKVGLVGRNQEVLLSMLDEFKGERIFIVPSSDITKEENIKQLVQDAEDILGRVDILVNNAGITKDALSLRMKKEDWDSIIALNLTTPFLLSQAILAKMMKRRYGRVINISSVVGLIGNIGQANYSASKGGLMAMTKTLAREYASRGITINSVAPGFIETKMTDVISIEEKQKLLASIPLGKMGTPEDVAYAVAFLATEEAAYITGQTLNVNGGMVMV